MAQPVKVRFVGVEKGVDPLAWFRVVDPDHRHRIYTMPLGNVVKGPPSRSEDRVALTDRVFGATIHGEPFHNGHGWKIPIVIDIHQEVT